MMSPNQSFLKELFVFIYFFETLCTHVGHSEKFKTGFVPTESEIKYFEDVPGVTISQSFSDDQTFSYQDEEGTITVLGSPIKFDPPSINFKQQPVGVPALRKVRVFNINSHSSIQMLSISGNTIHFHCSFFTDKVIPPGGNATFDVVFLGRDPGFVENTLYIHTSAGSFRYNVEGEGTPNLYRLHPLVGVRLPVNSSYSPVIHIHNPHPTTIQVLEMYSSGGDLRLELPTHEGVADKKVWEIPPYHTKGVMKANFLARVESNNTAYIRIKTNSTGGEFLYLPLEIEVTSAPGIFCPQEVLNFGQLPSEGGPASLEVSLLNSGSRPVTLASLVSTPVTEAISIDLSAVKVAPSTTRATTVARVTYDPSVGGEGRHSGKLVIKTKNSQQRLLVPWSAEVLKGGLHWNQTFSKFLLMDKPDPEDPAQAPYLTATRPLTVTNKFAVPIAVHSVLLAPEAEKLFHVGRFKTKVIRPGDTATLLRLSVREGVRGKEEEGGRNLNTYITLLTNITSVQIPIMVFDGKLQSFFPSAPSEKVLDFGTIGMNEKREMYFALINRGPVKIVLRGWGGNITGSLIELMGVAEGTKSDILSRSNFTSLARKLYVPPRHYVVYRIGLLTGSDEGEVWASVFVSTEFQDIQVPFRFRVAKGSLSTVPGQINFGTNFPGRSTEVSLSVFSSFKHRMRVKSLSVVGGDPRFSFLVDEGAPIHPGEKSVVGKVVFDPGAGCRVEDDCYTGFSPWGKFGHPWYLGLALPLNLGEMDLTIVHTLWARMRSAALGNSQFNVTLRLDTTEVRGFHFTARAALSWPILCLDALRRFPLTQIGNSTREEILLINPSQEPVFVHLVPMAAYPNALNILSHLPNRIRHEEEEIIPDPDDESTFRIESVMDAYDPFAALRTFGDDFAEKFGIGVAPNTYPMVLEPGQAVKVSVLFTPTDSSQSLASVLFVRNNLTGVETIDLVGRGALGDIKFGNKRTGSTIHAFDVTEKHLKDCDKEPAARSLTQPNLTVKRHFTARNTGQVPIWVTGFEIDGFACEGYGFKVLDCEPFELAANDSRRINIAFTPDFTLARVTRTLTMKTSLSSVPGKGDVKYSLAATVPPHLLSVCARSLPRPRWEGYLYLLMISLMLISLLCILAASVMEADRILKYCYIMTGHTTHQVPENAKLLDLREVARLALQECAERERSSSPASHNRMISTASPQRGEATPDPLNTQPKFESNGGPFSLPKGIISFFLSYFSDFSRTPSDLVSRYSSLEQDSVTTLPPEPGCPISTPSSTFVKQPKLDPPEVGKSPPGTAASSAKKSKKSKVNESATKSRPKISAQNSVNDDLETSSTTTESSNPEDLGESTSKAVVSLNSDLPVVAAESAKKKKKNNARKVEEVHSPPKESKSVQTKPKKVDKTDHKPEKPEKAKLSPKPSRETSVKPASPSPSTPPVVKKQEAKVKGIPKDGGELRRQQSLPTYDKPPRLQQARTECHAGFPALAPTQPLEGFPALSLPRSDPPRAIIYPELKREMPVNQFGAIGCKVPVNAANSWNDTTTGSSPLSLFSGSGSINSSPGGLISSPGGMSIMQELQAERRYREEPFRRSQWPGFSTEPVRRDYLESLWDPPAAPNPQARWGTIGPNVWPSTVLQSTAYTQHSKPAEQEGFGLDPLSLSSIWGAANKNERENSGTTWSSTLFNSNKDL